MIEDIVTHPQNQGTAVLYDRTVYTGGTFDLLHAGHVDFLAVCRKIAGDNGRVVVSLNGDDFVESYKGKPPICSYYERKDVLMACRYVDEVILNSGKHDSKPAILEVNPDFILIGDDWAHRDYYKQMSFTPEWLAELNIVLLYVPRLRVLSSTDIKARIR
jgi:glycerol-3-phosphate cytidylyltransferase